jgi:hypothetical protein
MTVVARRVVSTPVRTASETWSVITTLLAPKDGPGRNELTKISGVACSLIASEAMEYDAIVVYGNGPRVRVYCLFGEAAMSADGKNEDALVTCPTENDWSLSLPCLAEDLAWVKSELARLSSRITARELGDTVPEEEAKTSNASVLRPTSSINEDAFFRS